MNYKTLLLKKNNFDNPTFLDNITEINLDSSYKYEDFEKDFNTIINENDYADDYLLIIVDEKANSILNKEQMNTLLHTCKLILKNNDIIYLSNFLDNCDTNLIVKENTDDSISHIKFYKSIAPNGLYCVVSTFSKWKTILTKTLNQEGETFTSQLSSSIISKNISAVTTWPRVVIPNIDIISDSIENYYTYPCRFEKVYGRTVPNTEQMSFYWFAVGSLIVIFSTWLLVKVSPKNKYIFYNKNKK